MLYTNIRSLPANFSELQIIIKQRNPSIVFLSETRTIAPMYDSEFEIQNYKLIRCDSDSTHTGGVAIYIKKCVHFKIISNFMRDRVWFLAIQIIKGFHVSGIYGVLYKSDEISNSVFLNNLDEWCENIIDLNKINVICGDFNINIKKDSFYANKLLKLIEDNNLMQIVKQYTRVTSETRTLIDLVLTNSNNISCSVLEIDQITDHHMMAIQFENNQCDDTQILPSGTYVSWKNYSKDKLGNMLNEVDWNIDSTNGLNENAEIVVSSLEKCMGKMLLTVPVVKINKNPWFNNHLRLLKKRKNEHWLKLQLVDNPENRELYRVSRNVYKQSLREESTKYIQMEIKNNMNNPKGLWRIIKSFYTSKNTDISNIYIDGEAVYEKQELAEKLNQSFVKSIVAINESIPLVQPSTSFNCNIIEPTYKFQFKPVNIDIVKNICKNLKSNLSTEGINKRCLLDALDNYNFATAFVNILNKSLQDGSVPTKWKISTVIPIPKVQTPQVPADLRPINTLPVYEGVLERIIKEHLVEYINENNILVNEQSGFRSKHSCETAINLVLNNWKSRIDAGNIIIAVFLDFKRAFETIDRDILIYKLEQYGIRGCELRWFKDYLSNRYQRVKIQEHMSETELNQFGVPQGSVLGPTLFTLYINGIIEVVKNCYIHMFADDTLVTVAENNISEAVTKINQDLERIDQWLKYHKLALNISKTKYMVITLRRNFDRDVNIEIGGSKIDRVAEYKYLGVIIDDCLNFNAHLDYTVKKMNKKLGLLKRLQHKMPRDCKEIYYKSLVSPHIDYCSSVLFIMNSGQIETLQKIQNKFMRLILRAERRTHIVDLLDRLHWQSIKQRIYFNTLKLIYHMIKGDLPEYLKKLLVTNRDIHKYETRNTHYRLPVFVKTCSQQSLYYKGLNEYNKMQDVYKNCNLKELSLKEFLKLLCSYIKDKVEF